MRRLWSRHPRLLLLNLALVGVIVGLGAIRVARAQNAVRVHGEYTMVAGLTTSGGSHVVYVLDSANQELVALRWDQSKSAMAGVGYRNLAADAQAQPGR